MRVQHVQHTQTGFGGRGRVPFVEAPRLSELSFFQVGTVFGACGMRASAFSTQARVPRFLLEDFAPRRGRCCVPASIDTMDVCESCEPQRTFLPIRARASALYSFSNHSCVSHRVPDPTTVQAKMTLGYRLRRDRTRGRITHGHARNPTPIVAPSCSRCALGGISITRLSA